MLSKAKLKAALKAEDRVVLKEAFPTFKQFKIMARDTSYRALIMPTIKLLFSDQAYYKKVFCVNVMTTMSIFTHEVMKDFKYLKEAERDEVYEVLLRPLLNNDDIFHYAINHYFELKYFQITFVKYKNELAKRVIDSPDLFWRVIQNFEQLHLFCEENPECARQAIMIVLLTPAKMQTFLLNAIAAVGFAGHCMVYGLVDANTYKELAASIIESAKKLVNEPVMLATQFRFFGGKEKEKVQTSDRLTPIMEKR